MPDSTARSNADETSWRAGPVRMMRRQGWMFELLGDRWDRCRTSWRRVWGTGVGRKERVEWRDWISSVRLLRVGVGMEKGGSDFLWGGVSSVCESIEIEARGISRLDILDPNWWICS